MQQLKVDRTPLYLQAQQYLLDLIADGTVQPGEQLPAEADLAAQLGISRPTLREALHNLERTGVIIRRHGVGTFVSPHAFTLESGLEVLESLNRQAQRLGLETQVVYLDIAERSATAEEGEKLALAPDEATDVFSVDRVIAVKEEPVAYLRDVVPRTYLQREDLGAQFTGSVLDILLRKEAVTPVVSRTQIGAEEASERLASLLGVPQGAALLKWMGQLYGYHEEVLDYSISYFVPGHFKFHITRRVDKGMV